MKLALLSFWVLGLMAVIHYCVLGRVDVSSFLAGAFGVVTVLFISWDSRVEEWEYEE